MVVEKLIQTLDKLLQLHQNLYEVALQKTDVLKSDHIEELKELLKKEQMFVQALRQVEDERIKHTVEFLDDGEDATLSACIEKAEEAEKERLQVILNEFTDIMNKLKERNMLNKELTKQALQLTSITLDMFIKQEPDINYNKPVNTKQNSEKQRRSIFDSKA